MRISPVVTFVFALVSAFLTLFFAQSLPAEQKYTLCVLAFMVTAWIFEGIPFGAVALVPLIAFPLLGIAPLATVTRSYATPTVALFFGGFVLALSVERAGLHERMAHFLLSKVGASPRRSCFVFLVLAGFLSMWMSNTSVALLLVPLAVGFGKTVATRSGLEEDSTPLGQALSLAVAYGANLGGIATPIGSPPNGMLAAALTGAGAEGISFHAWMSKMLPLWLLLVPLAWGVLLFAFPKAFRREPKASECLTQEGAEVRFIAPRSKQPWSSREKRVLLVVLATIVCWWTVPFLPMPSHLMGETDALIALCAAFLLLTLPSGSEDKQALLEWEHTKSIAWNILFLFGAGLALSQALQSSGLSALMATVLSKSSFHFDAWHLFGVVSGVLFATEIVSNTALAATLLPIVLAWEDSLGLSRLMLSLPITVAVSLAFMMPIATPPNAIAYGLGKVPLARMLVAGLAMNVLSAMVLTLWFSV